MSSFVTLARWLCIHVFSNIETSYKATRFQIADMLSLNLRRFSFLAFSLSIPMIHYQGHFGHFQISVLSKNPRILTCTYRSSSTSKRPYCISCYWIGRNSPILHLPKQLKVLLPWSYKLYLAIWVVQVMMFCIRNTCVDWMRFLPLAFFFKYLKPLSPSFYFVYLAMRAFQVTPFHIQEHSNTLWVSFNVPHLHMRCRNGNTFCDKLRLKIAHNRLRKMCVCARVCENENTQYRQR